MVCSRHASGQAGIASPYDLQEASLIDWDDLDYQLAAASEELMKAHARAEQLTEEKSLLERRWARIQASTHVSKTHTHEFLANELEGSAETFRQMARLHDTDTLQTCSDQVQPSAPPPSLAEAIPEVLKHASHSDHEVGKAAQDHSVQPGKSSGTMALPVARSKSFSAKSHPSKSVLTTVPTSFDSHPSQQGRCVRLTPQSLTWRIKIMRQAAFAVNLTSGGSRMTSEQQLQQHPHPRLRFSLMILRISGEAARGQTPKGFL